MCLMVYLAAAKPLRLVPWIDDAPDFNVTELAADEGRVAIQFTDLCMAHAGSHEGCGCGFQYAKWPADSYSREEIERGQRSRDAFADYLVSEIGRVGAIQVFACWDGDQEAEPEHRRRLRPSDLRSPDFFFLEKELSAVVSEDAG
jgi:hypothetical protein